jgi:hypothetical protein
MSSLIAMVSCLLAVEGVAVDVAARAEARGATAATGFAPGATGAMQVDGALGASSDFDALRLSAGYSPRATFSVADGTGYQGADVLQSARLGADFSPSAIEHFGFYETFSYGQQDFSPLIAPQVSAGPALGPAAQPGAPPTTILDPRLSLLVRLAYFSSRTGLGYTTAFSPRLRLAVQGGYAFSGGADEIGRTFLPLQHAADVGSNLFWSATPRDDLSIGFTTSAARLPAEGRTDAIFIVNGGWQGAPAAFTRADISLGGGVATGRAAGVHTTSPAVQASAGIAREFPLERQQLNAALRASVAATIDRIGGGVYEMGGLRALLGYSPSQVLRLSATTGVERPLTGGTARGGVLVASDVGASLALKPKVTLGLGARAAWRQGYAFGTGTLPDSTQWLGYASIGFAESGRY